VSIAAGTFGSGGSEPYASALRHRESNILYLRDAYGDGRRHLMDIGRWNADADDADLTLLSSVTGPVLDIGSGPGRMVRAAMNLGLDALGIDVSPTAVDVARALGGSFLQRSIFDPLPGEGTWQTALLVDGNIGIGGDVPTLIARCRDLLAPSGEIVIELDGDPDHEEQYLAEVVDSRGRRSASFRWAAIGRNRLALMLPTLGLDLIQSWELSARSFCRLAMIAK
jgi:SAM-dependent methyltransferase